ncbi:hypothetical protein J2T57_004454 [Natronocella acetinitrilica]|uniref:CNNM transmembrane domain-containing protein n=1 Tax=Natronocella acetinitrilica TaxID=414046 RepID=A0AAE3G7G3_9GAMM|nr:DUF21 domain-containing protein [Natronocella acetinitrilica]MCP1677275.1 hypothetical protein [Natronocella acetinitrilica]
MTLLTWIGILLCLAQSGMFSGLNLACFSVSKLELEISARKGEPNAQRLHDLRQDANFLLVTILWGNVAVNVLLALLAGSVLTGVLAFLFSTVVITICGEIVPQSYFSRHALQVASRLAPMLRIYQFLLWPVARPTAWVLDRWLGPEAISYFKEHDLRQVIRLHMESGETEINTLEGLGAMNFLKLDDLPLTAEGEPLDAESIVQLPFDGTRAIFPPVHQARNDDFLRLLHRSGKSRVVLVDESGEPRLLVDCDAFLRAALFDDGAFRPLTYCHRPIIIQDPATPLGDVIGRFRVKPEHGEDDVLDEDVILLWADEKRIITGTDILGRLLRGIVRNPVPAIAADTASAI